jgi:Ca-activated chloride channel homolog
MVPELHRNARSKEPTSNVAGHTASPGIRPAVCVLLALPFLSLVPVFAQQPPAQTAPPLRLSTTVERVNVDVAVTDAHGAFLSGLARSAFHVFDNGAEQPITDFSTVEDPMHILLLVEISPAVYMLSQEHVLAAYRLLDGLHPDDSVALATYDDRVHGVLGFTQDKSLIAQALGRLQFSLGMARLNLFGSLAEAVAMVAPRPATGPPAQQAFPGRVAIVLLSTGLSDVRDPAVRQMLKDRLETSGAAVYTVALGGALRTPVKEAAKPPADSGIHGGPTPLTPSVAFAVANKDLRELAESSGGRAFFPSTAKDLDAAYREIAVTLRHIYSLAFVPPAHDGQIHTLRVELRDAAGRPLAPREGRNAWTLLTRPAYLAPSP